MRFRARSRSRSTCGCETGAEPAPTTRNDDAAWTLRTQPACSPEVIPNPAEEIPHSNVAATSVAATLPGTAAGAVRGTAAGAVSGTADRVALSSAPVGCRGRITAVATPGAPALAHRLQDLGFVTGATVEVVRRAPLGDPVLYRVADYEICLRRAQAAVIQVRVLAPEHATSAAPVAVTSATAA